MKKNRITVDAHSDQLGYSPYLYPFVRKNSSIFSENDPIFNIITDRLDDNILNLQPKSTKVILSNLKQ